MSVHIQPPVKTGVTSVTRVTHLVERPVSLAFMPVTHLSGLSYTRCNARPACNTEFTAQLLRADALRSHLKSGSRWPCLSKLGRGTHRDSVPGILGDD